MKRCASAPSSPPDRAAFLRSSVARHDSLATGHDRLDLRTQEHDAHQCVSACLSTVGLQWDVDRSSALGILPSILIVGLLLVPLCALFSGLTLGRIRLQILVGCSCMGLSTRSNVLDGRFCQRHDACVTNVFRAAGLLSLDINGLKVCPRFRGLLQNAIESLWLARSVLGCPASHSACSCGPPRCCSSIPCVTQILQQGGEPKERKYASAIMPVREKGEPISVSKLKSPPTHLHSTFICQPARTRMAGGKLTRNSIDVTLQETCCCAHCCWATRSSTLRRQSSWPT